MRNPPERTVAVTGPPSERLVPLSDNERQVLLDAIETAAVDWAKPGRRGTSELQPLVDRLNQR